MIAIKESDNITYFSSTQEKLDKLKEWGLVSAKAKEIKKFKYKGAYTDKDVDCNVIGYIAKETNPKCINKTCETVVIQIGEETHKIDDAYLKQMQSKNFNTKMTE